MVADAEQHAAEDQKRRRLVDVRNQADSLIYTTEKALAEHGDAVSAEDKAAIEGAVADLKQAMEGDDADAIESSSDALAQASQKLGEAMYKAQQEQAAPGGGAADAAGAADPGVDDPSVVDADFEEVDGDPPKDKNG